MKKENQSVVIFFSVLAAMVLTLTALIIISNTHDIAAPGGRRWGAQMGEHVNLTGIDTAGYRVAVDCEITMADNGNGTTHLTCNNIGK